ncbi:MAG: chitobiase/beta-hexosaminidase C-terminal domain-containing protein [Lachnospiraceae bacterium]|nr:chitobiase/beta-hexosaminidase C-terminal domain-containing protein [Lachnospiraceae bacterium]
MFNSTSKTVGKNYLRKTSGKSVLRKASKKVFSRKSLGGFFRRTAAFTLAGVVAVTGIPGAGLSGFEGIIKAQAADVVGALNGRTYTSFEDLVDDLEDDYGSRIVTIDMYRSWNNEAESGSFDEMLVIPNGCNATLNMNGNVFDRGLAINGDSEWGGGLIYVEKNATLVVNGGDDSIRHDETVYTSAFDSGARTAKTFYGGVLTNGGNTRGSGGITMEKNATVTLNNVTIAGCYSSDFWGYGDGGGIDMEGEDSKLVMNNSTITGCYAKGFGGGLNQDNENNVIIEMNNSHIDSNYSDENGGGMYLEGESCILLGKNSTVNGNYSDDNGGGIYVWNDDYKITGLNIEENVADNGAGIYTLEEGIEMSKLTLKKNKASEKGGGIYICNDGNSINNCTITENSSEKSGAGVYVNDDVDSDFMISGATNIKENYGHNLYISDSNPEDSRVLFNLTYGADVHMSYYDTKDKARIFVTPGDGDDKTKSPNCIKYLTAENNGYVFAYNPLPNYRKILYVKKEAVSDASNVYAYSPSEVVKVKSYDAHGASERESTGDGVAGKVGTVAAGGAKGTEYDLIRGFMYHERSVASGKNGILEFYYSDGLFDSDPYKYNDHLATLSWSLAFAGTYLNGYNEADKNGNIYYNKHAGGRQFLADIGCKDEDIYVNSYMTKKPTIETIGVSIASKKLKKADGTETGYVLVPVTVRGAGYEAEWANNALIGTANETLDSGCEAKCFSAAADRVYGEVMKYISEYGLEDEYEDGKIKFWVSGHSRAGATANLTSKRLLDKIHEDNNGSQVFGYDCEAPKGGTDNAEVSGVDYTCIHNLLNPLDMVTYIPTKEMGFKRYGVDHYIPGTSAGEVRKTVSQVVRGGTNGVTKVTTYADNYATETKTDAYDALYKKMEKQLKGIDADFIYDDYFHPMAMDFVPSPNIYEVGSYDNARLESFVSEFVAFAQEANDPTKTDNKYQTIPSRDYYAATKFKLNDETYNSLQEAISDCLYLMFGIPGGKREDVFDKAGGIMNVFDFWDLFDLYFSDIGEWTDKTDSEKSSTINRLWDRLSRTGALADMEEEQLTILKRSWPTLVNAGFTFLDADYNLKMGKDMFTNSGWNGGAEKSMMFLATFFTYVGTIFDNHCPEINIAWIRTYDNWFDEEAKDYQLVPDEDIDAPEGSCEYTDNNGETQSIELKADDENANEIVTNKAKVYLRNDNLRGEAIYYDLYDITNGEEAKIYNSLYYKGVDLNIDSTVSLTKYKIVTYDMSYGVKSEEKTYYINVYSNRHKLTIADENDEGPRTQNFYYVEGKDAMVMTKAPEGKVFKKWEFSLYDINGDLVRDITDEIYENAVSTTKNTSYLKFVMPEVNDDYPKGYSIVATAVYTTSITNIDIEIDAPVAGETLDDKVDAAFDNGDSGSYDISWSYTVDDVVHSDSGEAYNDTAYTATITMEENLSKAIQFANNVTATTNNGTIKSVEKNKSTGAVTVVITFDKTADVGGADRPDTQVKINVKPMDMNLENEISLDNDISFTVNKGKEAIIIAPEISDKSFVMWDYSETGIKPATGYNSARKTIKLNIPTDIDSEVDIIAYYVPVIKNIEVQIDRPVGGKKAATEATMIIEDSERYEVNPENIKVEWIPDTLNDGSFDYGVNYTAQVSIVVSDDYTIKIRKEGTEDWIVAQNRVLYSKSITTSMNGNEALFDDYYDTVSYTFPVTTYTLTGIERPEDITNLPNGTKVEDVLPETIKIKLNDGSTQDIAVSWDYKQVEGLNDERDAAAYVATTRIDLPENVTNRNQIDLAVAMNVYVNAANKAIAPTASKEAGTYLEDFNVTLSTEEKDSAIYYTLDGSSPKDASNEKRIKYDSELIDISRIDSKNLQDELDSDGNKTGRKMLVLKAVTVKDGLFDSDIAIYNYVFGNEIPLPKGEKLTFNNDYQIGIYNSEFYTLEEKDGVVIDNEGNATAKNAGTYSVTAKLKDGYKWEAAEEGAEGTDAGTATNAEDTEDKVVTFTIERLDISENGKLDCKDSYDSLEELKKDVKVSYGDIELTTDDYELEVGDVEAGVATVSAIGIGNYKGSVSKAVELNIVEPSSSPEESEEPSESPTESAVTPSESPSTSPSASPKNASTLDDVEDIIDDMTHDNDIKGSEAAPLLLRCKKHTKNSIKLTWNKAKGATKYVLYGHKCGKTTHVKKFKVLKKTTINIKKIKKMKLKKNTYYKFMLVAIDNKENVISISKLTHVATDGGKKTNAKKIFVKSKIDKNGKKLKKYKLTNAIKLKAGYNINLKTYYTKENKKGIVHEHVGMRYESGNKKVFTVNKQGVITAKKKGTAKVVVYAQNGRFKKVKITVVE